MCYQELMVLLDYVRGHLTTEDVKRLIKSK